jgi:hypothetical protein
MEDNLKKMKTTSTKNKDNLKKMKTTSEKEEGKMKTTSDEENLQKNEDNLKFF